MLSGDLKTVEAGLRSDMKTMETGLRNDMQTLELGLRDDMHGLELGIAGLRTEMGEKFNRLLFQILASQGAFVGLVLVLTHLVR